MAQRLQKLRIERMRDRLTQSLNLVPSNGKVTDAAKPRSVHRLVRSSFCLAHLSR